MKYLIETNTAFGLVVMPPLDFDEALNHCELALRDGLDFTVTVQGKGE